MVRLLWSSMLLAIAASGCSPDPGASRSPSAFDKIMEENRKSSEATVHAAKEAARQAADHAADLADFARETADGFTTMARRTFGGDDDAAKRK